MGRFSKLNTKHTKWNKTTEGFEYVKLKDYIESHGDDNIKVYGYYINDTDLGEALTIITEDSFINMPSHAVETFKSFTEEDDEAINSGLLEIGNFREVTIKRFKKKTIYFDFIDVE